MVQGVPNPQNVEFKMIEFLSCRWQRATPMRTTATLAIAIASIVIGKAQAADMAPLPPGAAPLPPVTYGNMATPNAYGNYDWSGVYLGGNGGVGWYEGGNSFLVSNGLTDNLGNLLGFTFGGQVGYNWQIGTYVLGVEGDLQWSGAQTSLTATCGTGCAITGQDKIDGFATLRGRAGIAFSGVLVYGTAGGAWVDGSSNVIASAPGGSVTVNPSGSAIGWTAGGGVEIALLSQWSGKIEYLFIDAGSLSSTATIPAALGGGTISATAPLRDSIFRVGFNYRFPVTPWFSATH
jgi:outer membrane immunogenic protein